MMLLSMPMVLGLAAQGVDVGCVKDVSRPLYAARARLIAQPRWVNQLVLNGGLAADDAPLGQ